MTALTPADLATSIETEHTAAATAAKSAIEHAIRCGELLAQAKETLPHGQWIPWVRRNLSFDERQAQKYMRAAAHATELRNATPSSHLTGALKAIATTKTTTSSPPPPRRPEELAVRAIDALEPEVQEKLIVSYARDRGLIDSWRADGARREREHQEPRPDPSEALRTSADVDQKAALVCRLAAAIHEHVAEVNRDTEAQAGTQFGVIDFLVDLRRGDGYEEILPFLVEALGLPTDPWPGLTGDDLVRMTKGRIKEAGRKGIRTAGGAYELDLDDKLRATQHREWLLGEAKKEAAVADAVPPAEEVAFPDPDDPDIPLFLRGARS